MLKPLMVNGGGRIFSPGKSAVEQASAKPNPMINGHQDWLDGLVAAAKARK
ncbi:hypothetical protein [Pantoea rodasii]|uniref:hypothetical protein n=1 Tax=Pantoea rodasii TaxID=1076549 RepID=UPI001F0CB151|nr:hypothetical protein [Pantoea rodasii]